jgi:hypothetical protein
MISMPVIRNFLHCNAKSEEKLEFAHTHKNITLNDKSSNINKLSAEKTE